MMSSDESLISDTTSETSPKKFRGQLDEMKSKLTVEPLFLMTTMANILIKLAIQNLNLEKACRVNLEYDSIVCDALMARNYANYSVEHENVQKIVVGMFGWKTIVQNVLPAFFILFWGSWSDHFHIRKPVIMIPVFGEFLLVVGLILCTYIKNSPLEAAILTEAVFSALSGSSVMLFMGINSYISDITTEAERTSRLGIIHIIYMVGLEMGNALNGVLLKLIGYYGIFSISATIHMIAIIYGIIFLKESTLISNAQPLRIRKLFFEFFNVKYVANQFKMIFMHTDCMRTKKICMIILASVLLHGQAQGTIIIEYLYTRLRFNWDEVNFSAFIAYVVVLRILGTTISISIFTNVLKCHDTLLAMIALICKVIALIAYTFAFMSWHMFAIVIIDMFHVSSLVTIKSMMSKMVADTELAKVNALLGMGEYVAPLICVPIYTNIYSATLATNSSAFFLIGVPIVIAAFLINLSLYKSRIRTQGNIDNYEDETQTLHMSSKSRTRYGSVCSSLHSFYVNYEFNC